ncbi:MAG: SDR family oxidoreductase [Chitinophagales bacterium]|nr:SDR family oxidoreductase [Chitinophagales bacterium]
MSKIKNANVLITGGAQGIGKLLGEKFLREGAGNLIIWDINDKNIEQTLNEFDNKGYQNVHAFNVDVSDVKDVERAATEVLLEIGNVDILINNAGIVVGKMFWEHSMEEIDRVMQINVGGVLYTTRVFINEMIKQKRGHIVNIASAASFIRNRKMSIYLASKWAVKGWSDSLRLEVETLGGDLHVTTICPSYINTGMFKGVKAPLLTPLLEPEVITDAIIKAVKKNEVIVLKPDIVQLLPILSGLLPTKLYDLTAEILGVYDSMDEFSGRNKKEAIPDKKDKQKVKK